MRPPRLVLVSRQFWPRIGGAERVMADLAAEFRAAGAEVTLLSAQWDRAWPGEIVHAGVRVVRLPQPRLRWYGTWRYVRGLRRWLIAHREEFDLVYVSMLKHDAYAAVSCRRIIGRPVVLRAEGAGQSGDVAWQRANAWGGRIRAACQRADAVVAPGPIIYRELMAAGYRTDRVHSIANGVRIPPPRVEQDRREARASLAEAHPLLAQPGSGPIGLYTGRLHDGKGLAYLISAWAEVSEKLPGAQLWLVGEGPSRDRLFRLVADLGLDGRVVLCGAFDTVDEFLAAADWFILPSLEEGMSLSLLEAMAAGLPVVASAIPANETIVENERDALLVPPKDSHALAAALLRLAAGPGVAVQLGMAARARVVEEFSLSQTVRRHLELFERLIATGSSGRGPA